MALYSISIKNKNILDVGCAGGGTIKLLKKLGSLEQDISGIDIRKATLLQIKEVYPIFSKPKNLRTHYSGLITKADSY